jgi:hypothetical protein
MIVGKYNSPAIRIEDGKIKCIKEGVLHICLFL